MERRKLKCSECPPNPGLLTSHTEGKSTCFGAKGLAGLCQSVARPVVIALLTGSGACDGEVGTRHVPAQVWDGPRVSRRAALLRRESSVFTPAAAWIHFRFRFARFLALRLVSTPPFGGRTFGA